MDSVTQPFLQSTQMSIIDDQDLAVVYSSGWSQRGEFGGYNATAAFTQTAGSNATLRFEGALMNRFCAAKYGFQMTFVFSLGVTVAVIGTIWSSNANLSAPLSSYTIDGNLPSTFEPTAQPIAQRHQQIFSLTVAYQQQSHTDRDKPPQ